MHDLPTLGRHLLDAVAGLVRELAEADLVGMRGGGEHLDVGTGTEELVEPAGDDDRLDRRMLEAQSLQRVVQLDVDAEVVGVELQLVVVTQPTVRIDRHGERRDRPVDLELPVPVTGGLGLEAEARVCHGLTHHVSLIL